uniref:Uncharacterized protein n=1 Tax=Oryza rufipogon TaxID=4529 RepID=A0A0E0MV36_ORYRU
MVHDSAGVDDTLRASSSGAPVGVLLERQANECEEDNSTDKSEWMSAVSRRRGCDRQGDNVQASQ